MGKRNFIFAGLCLIGLLVVFGTVYGEKAATAVDVKKCYACHEEIKDFHMMGKHKTVNCANCHEVSAHLKDPMTLPMTKTEHAVCGKCHPDEYGSLVAVNLQSKAKVEKATFKSRSPLFDKLIMPHGFSKEHAEPRSHVFMLVDHLIVDRAYGGRFELKDWTKISDASGAEKNAWDVLTDREPQTAEQKAFIPQSATAANPVCLQCKTQDRILKWKYMGDPDPKAAWSRTSKVVEFARDLKHPINCFTCHDPHSAEPRIVRDALIETVVDKGMGAYPYDKEKSAKTMVKNEEVGFKDFKHAVTGALLTKLQHPEAETYWGSKHERAGVECKDCHMPRVKNKAGKAYTWHGQKSARYMKKDTCIKCHPYWTEEEAEYEMDAIQNYIRGKMTKAEFWLGQLIDKYSEAKKAGVPEDVLKQARDAHDIAHILWEWWTAENSDGFHNPAMARESLARSVSASQDGIKLLDKAMAGMGAKGGSQ